MDAASDHAVKLYRFLLVCEHTTVPLSTLLAQLQSVVGSASNRHGSDAEHLKSILKSRPEWFSLASSSSEKETDTLWFVEAKVSIRVCSDYLQDADATTSCKSHNCSRLHMCYYFLKSKCRFGDSCNKQHDFYSDAHNREALTLNGLFGLRQELLLVLFKRTNLLEGNPPRVPSKSPKTKVQVCSFYNVVTGCRNADACSYLHICIHHAAKRGCKFGDDCKRSHNMQSDHNRKILNNMGITPNEAFIHLVGMEVSRSNKV